jgi:hypothetical protein
MLSSGLCLCLLVDQAGQIGESGSLGRKVWGEGRGYSEILRWQSPPVSIKDHVILALMDML